MSLCRVKVLSLCDGLSGGRLAFHELGVDVEYHAVEIDSHARNLADSNFLDIVRWQNDVTKITEEDIIEHGPFDWITFGSPCQTVSVAGNGTGLDGKSGLLYDCMNVLNWVKKHNPDFKFLIENVKMKKEFLEQFNKIIGVEPILINSSKLSAQRRERYYWCNFKVSQPEDSGEYLKDILEPSVPDSMYIRPKNISRITESRICWDSNMKGQDSQADRAYHISGKSPCVPAARTESKVNIFEFVDREKAFCLDASYHKGTTLKEYIEKSRRQVVFAYSSSIRETGIESRSNLSGKANTLTTGDGCSAGYKSQTLVGEISEDTEVVFRKLTVRECARLQKIPEWYSFEAVSKTQAYRAIGNGWTTSVISHIISYGLGIKEVESWEYL